uniref:Potassium channel domain-containing protein n=1 Tax=Hemiselmis andersenii TaxID=464988 RepID=A0A7S1E3M7_HEMAN
MLDQPLPTGSGSIRERRGKVSSNNLVLISNSDALDLMSEETFVSTAEDSFGRKSSLSKGRKLSKEERRKAVLSPSKKSAPAMGRRDSMGTFRTHSFSVDSEKKQSSTKRESLDLKFTTINGASPDDEGDGKPQKKYLERSNGRRIDMSLEEVSSKDREWWHDRDKLDAKAARWNLYAAVFSSAGLVASIAQHELVFMERDPKGPEVDICKAINMLCSISSCCAVVAHYTFGVYTDRIYYHLNNMVTLRTDRIWLDVIVHKMMWAEIAFLMIHLPPGWTFEVSMDTMGNVVVYRAESLMCLINSFRAYLILRVVKDHVLLGLPLRHTISKFTSVQFAALFSFKFLLVGWHAVVHLASWWGVLIIVSGYWYRIAENSACQLSTTESIACEHPRALQWSLTGQTFEQTNDPYYYNPVWVMFITSSTVGYGDFSARTHLGRFITVLNIGAAIALVSLLTASLSNALLWNNEENQAIIIAEREQAKITLFTKAATYLQLWWKRISGRSLEGLDVFAIRREFFETHSAAKLDMEECHGEGAKVDQTLKRSRKVCVFVVVCLCL